MSIISAGAAHPIENVTSLSQHSPFKPLQLDRNELEIDYKMADFLPALAYAEMQLSLWF